ncbi:hypothetical protein SC206_19815 [Rouxiella sp. T17]|uniref:hypothetical protein n=1 Tax=Rouxiella sp. T17 TaxID=3085684 RepID=UPI002FC715F1
MVKIPFKIGYPQIATLCLCLFLAGCVQPKALPKEITLDNTTCAEAVSDNPKLIYLQMNDCIDKSQKKRAAYLYAQAGTLTWYQSLIDKSETSRLAHKNLPTEALAKLSDSERKEFTETLESTLDDNKLRQQICSRLLAPKVDYNVELANSYSDKWLLAKKGYLHCI